MSDSFCHTKITTNHRKNSKCMDIKAVKVVQITDVQFTFSARDQQKHATRPTTNTKHCTAAAGTHCSFPWWMNSYMGWRAVHGLKSSGCGARGGGGAPGGAHTARSPAPRHEPVCSDDMDAARLSMLARDDHLPQTNHSTQRPAPTYIS